jgi:4-hydroxy-tetrahydrodipicolinate reductase
MKLALIGYGKMGRVIEQAALNKGHEIVSKIDPKETHTTITAESLNGAEICLDFSRPDKVVSNILQAASLGKSLVVGTTGWYEQIPEVKKIVEKFQIGLVYAPNFSIGVQLFLRLVEQAAKWVDEYEEYDIAGFEAHHAKKVDIPSGTAQSMIALLLKNLSRKTKIKINSLEKPLEKEEIHLTSLRCGSIPGEHRVIFDSEYDTLEIKHSARSRTGFAYGAIVAAERLQGKKGFFHLDEILTPEALASQ